MPRRSRWPAPRTGRRWWPGLPPFGPSTLAGLIGCLLVLAPGLLAAELLVRAYEARLTEDARTRAMTGLEAAAGLVDAERTRALNNADLVASRLGLLATSGTPPDALVKPTADLRAGLRTSLVALVDSNSRTLASDPASNLPFGTTWEARQALQGKSVVVLQERVPGLAVQAAAPLRVNGEIVPGVAIVAHNLDDTFLNTSLRLTGLDLALIQNGRLVAASRGIRRSFSFATDQTLDGDLLASGSDRFKRVRLGNETFFLAGRTLMNGTREIGTVLVGTSADAVADAVWWARGLTYGAALLGSLLAALLGLRIGRWQARRAEVLAQRVRLIGQTGAQVGTSSTGMASAGAASPGTAQVNTASAVAISAGTASARPRDAFWSALDTAIDETSATVRLQSEDLRTQTSRLTAVLGSLAEGIIVADEQRHVIFANPVARQLLQLPAGSPDQPFHGPGGLESNGDIGRHDTAENNTAENNGALDRNGTPGGNGALGDHPDLTLLGNPAASQRVIRSYSAAVLGTDGRALGYVTVLRDATEEQEVEHARTELLGVVSHELQTPLTAIKGALELVIEEDEGRLSRVQQRFLKTIDRNCARMIGLVGDLLDLSRLDAGRLALDSRPLDTPSIIQSTVATLANLFERRRQTIRVAAPASTPPILGDRRRVEQILTNLLSNAAKYTPEGGLIEVAAAADDGRVRIVVADSGPGIPEAERALVFGRFYRGKDANRHGEPGSGLGLAIVKSLTELHGGAVRVIGPADGAATRGARFVVELPRAPDDE